MQGEKGVKGQEGPSGEQVIFLFVLFLTEERLLLIKS